MHSAFLLYSLSKLLKTSLPGKQLDIITRRIQHSYASASNDLHQASFRLLCLLVYLAHTPLFVCLSVWLFRSVYLPCVKRVILDRSRRIGEQTISKTKGDAGMLGCCSCDARQQRGDRKQTPGEWLHAEPLNLQDLGDLFHNVCTQFSVID